MAILIPNEDQVNAISTAFLAEMEGEDASVIAKTIVEQAQCECISEDLVSEINDKIAHEYGNLDPVTFVGSAKLGISLKELQATGMVRGFGENSDIDIAICDSELFDLFWVETYDHFCSDHFWNDVRGYQKYFFRGWIRPDLLPHKIGRRNEWFDFFRDVSRMTLNSAHDIRAGLYKSDHFLKTYQAVAIRKAQNRLELIR